jgi:hypothetical protein
LDTGLFGFWECRIVVQKGQSLLARAGFGPFARRQDTTLMNDESDISVGKYLFLLGHGVS